MKRVDILRKLAEAGCTFEEGGNHTLVYKDGKRVSVISRQKIIPRTIVFCIEKQTGVKLLPRS